jgi:hypothetical protein
MTRPTFETDFLPLDIDRVRPRSGTSEVVSWIKGRTVIGNGHVRSVDVPPGLIVSFTVSEGPGVDPQQRGGHPIRADRDLCHRLSFRTAALRFGTRVFFSCPACSRACRMVFIRLACPTEPPRCRRCSGGRYACDLHWRRHPLARRRRALRLIERGRDLILRRGVQAGRRAQGVALLAEGERQLLDLLADVAQHGLELVGHLEGRLTEARRSRRSA